jgi:hypothetical protein
VPELSSPGELAVEVGGTLSSRVVVSAALFAASSLPALSWAIV